MYRSQDKIIQMNAESALFIDIRIWKFQYWKLIGLLHKSECGQILTISTTWILFSYNPSWFCYQVVVGIVKSYKLSGEKQNDKHLLGYLEYFVCKNYVFKKKWNSKFAICKQTIYDILRTGRHGNFENETYRLFGLNKNWKLIILQKKETRQTIN